MILGIKERDQFHCTLMHVMICSSFIIITCQVTGLLYSQINLTDWQSHSQAAAVKMQL